jgi:hypothetical protein
MSKVRSLLCVAISKLYIGHFHITNRNRSVAFVRIDPCQPPDKARYGNLVPWSQFDSYGYTRLKLLAVKTLDLWLIDDVREQDVDQRVMGQHCANEGVKFTDYYSEQSCTAGCAAFITGQQV